MPLQLILAFTILLGFHFLIRKHFCVSFLCRPFVEYKGVIPPEQIQDKKNELEREAKRLISEGAKIEKESEYVEVRVIHPVILTPNVHHWCRS